MSKKIIAIIIMIVVGLSYWIYQSTPIDEGLTEKEQICINSGGIVTKALCCKATSDFPNTCLIGPCGCSLENSHEVKICDCGPDKCFDGSECVFLDESANLLKDLEQETGIDFSEIKLVEFKWVVEITPKVQEVDVEGRVVEAMGISIEQEAEVKEFFENKGFEKDLYNVASGTVSELIGYKKNDIVCTIIGGFTGYKEAEGQWLPPDLNKKDIDVKCGIK